MVIEDGVGNANNTEQADGARCLKGEAMDNGMPIPDGNDVAEGYYSGAKRIQTYKRRKHVQLCSESKVQEDYRANVADASHLVDQSLGDDNCGMERCTWEANINHPKISCASATTVKKARKFDKDGKECSLQLGWMSHGLQNKTNGHADVSCNGCASSSNSDGHAVTEMSQNVLCNIFASENFCSLRKVLSDHFQETKLESVLDFSVINSRIKERAYEQSPALFLSDIQQIWRKLHDTGNKIVSLSKSLSNMSRISYCEQVGGSRHSLSEDEMQELRNRESDSHTRLEQTEDSGMHKICTCRHCGGKVDGVDCLVCDSCEEMYHVSCIQPAVKAIPHKSWYCTDCAASRIRSPNEDCAVCERLNAPRKLFNGVGYESLTPEWGTLNELEENSNCTHDKVQVSGGGKNNSICKICGSEVDGEYKKICGHSSCPNKFYHLRCLTSKQLKLHGPCWFCPSCLCQFCLTDRDDDEIVLCDGCDHAYHIYCMQPPRSSIPIGKWFCRKCNAGIQAIRQAKKAHESNMLRKTGQHGSKRIGNFSKVWNIEYGREMEKGEGMDMLLTAAKTLNNEDMLLSAVNTLDSEKTFAAIEIQ